MEILTGSLSDTTSPCLTARSVARCVEVNQNQLPNFALALLEEENTRCVEVARLAHEIYVVFCVSNTPVGWERE